LTPTYEARVDVDGTNLYIVCFGVGTPTVVFDSGWNNTHTEWVDMVHEVHTHTRVCAYDRPGVSLSGGTPRARSAKELAELLHGTLVKAQIPGPYIVVGHSIAALLDVVFADTYRQDTAGLVLIDGSHPDACQRWREALPPESPNDSADLREMRSTLVDCDTWWSRATSGSDDQWLAVAGDQAAAVTSLGDLPLIVLVSSPDPATWGDIPPDLIARLGQLRVDLHREHAALSTNGSLVVVEGTGHYIYRDQPQVVLDAILGVLEIAREK
jgi:pimeloyl-ACP methyl ester carboxylesterase